MLHASHCLERLPVIVVGTSQWTAPWLTEQNLAFALADRHPVLYIEPPHYLPTRHGRDGSARLRRVRLRGRELVVFQPVVLPLRSVRLSARASAPLYRAQLRSLVRRLGLEAGIVLAGDARPGVVGAARERIASYIVKDWIYDNAELLGRSSADLIAERDTICAGVDVVLAISPSLQVSLAAAGIDAQLLRHGFHADLTAEYKREPPSEYARFPGPRIVFAGRVDGRLDVVKLRDVARRFPAGSVLVIGPTSPRMPATDLAALQAEPNIQLLGARRREELPPYLAHADCLLIPYRDSVWSHHGSPLKLWDYLYAGPPIVGSGYTTLTDYPELVAFSNDDEEFVEEVARAIGDGSGAQERRAFALSNTWDARGLEFESILGSVLPSSVAKEEEPS